MSKNLFYEKKGPFPLKDIVKAIGFTGDLSIEDNFKIHGFESLNNADVNDITFFNSIKYKDLSLKTKAAACITSSNLSKFLPKKCINDLIECIDEFNNFAMLAPTYKDEIKYRNYELYFKKPPVNNNIATVKGVEFLRGAPVMSTDIRASASLIISALAAKGKSEISRIYHIDRGYDKIENKISLIGGDINRLSE